MIRFAGNVRSVNNGGATMADPKGRFGVHGGQYIPETLMNAGIELEEAYNRYKADTKDTIGFDEWRGTISKYAVAKDIYGKYIYDEKIAEAFHDVYLNKSNSTVASRYIIKVLKEKLKK